MYEHAQSDVSAQYVSSNIFPCNICIIHVANVSPLLFSIYIYERFTDTCILFCSDILCYEIISETLILMRLQYNTNVLLKVTSFSENASC